MKKFKTLKFNHEGYIINVYATHQLGEVKFAFQVVERLAKSSLTRYGSTKEEASNSVFVAYWKALEVVDLLILKKKKKEEKFNGPIARGHCGECKDFRELYKEGLCADCYETRVEERRFKKRIERPEEAQCVECGRLDELNRWGHCVECAGAPRPTGGWNID